MKNRFSFGLAGLVMASNCAFSATPSEGWYAGLMGTLSYTPSLDFTLSTSSFNALNSALIFIGNPPLLSPAGEIDYSVGGGGGGQLGYRYCGFRFEGQLLFNYSPYDTLKVGGYSIGKNQNTALPFPFSALSMSGSTSLGAALFNVYYDFYSDDWDDISWVPYVGLGIGYGYIQNKLELDFNTTPGLANPVIVKVDFKENTSTPVGQAIIGISYLFNDNFSMGLDYRYVTTKEINGFNERYSLHTLNLNFNYWFGEN
ncbi:outer membrane protein [Legionella jamestowniensis]|uniref:Opacity protein-like surface antigen n=1 Tax=Legionella jamestowniensis TaxID=455 RepID=A0A0W0UG21_9GAMM|nr:outer membrane beta-barrel protein [Legionella jamestowniensis]KTD06850.1 opacity protein-like surface antigen [Legionella jamestowniensis]SFL82270.1 outer membrane autotransporter barrel domain-containing protein [Legionella jamestowniensis DSM 19215]